MSSLNSDKTISEIAAAAKALEQEYDEKIPPTGYVIIRIDGRAFHTLTKDMDKPFDSMFVEAMDRAALTALNEMDAVLAYVQSDEITVVISPCGRRQDSLPFNGRVEKLTTLAASAATTGFVSAYAVALMNVFAEAAIDSFQHRGDPSYDVGDEAVKRVGKVIDAAPTFDARAIHVDSLSDVADNLLWRRVDCRKNAVSSMAVSEFSARGLHGKSTMERWQMLADAHGGDYKINDGLYWGRLHYKETVIVEDEEYGEVTRRVTKTVAATKENADMVLSALEAEVEACLAARESPSWDDAALPPSADDDL